jgi:hypothetical protein
MQDACSLIRVKNNTLLGGFPFLFGIPLPLLDVGG